MKTYKIKDLRCGASVFTAYGVRVCIAESSPVTPVMWEWSGIEGPKTGWFQFDDLDNFQTAIIWRYVKDGNFFTNTVEALKVEG